MLFLNSMCVSNENFTSDLMRTVGSGGGCICRRARAGVESGWGVRRYGRLAEALFSLFLMSLGENLAGKFFCVVLLLDWRTKAFCFVTRVFLLLRWQRRGHKNPATICASAPECRASTG